MKPFDSAGSVLEPLRLLAEWLRVKHPGKHFEIVVAGGSALLLLGLQRGTFDIDVLDPEVLPYELLEGSRIVARSRGLGAEWLSTGVARVVREQRRNRQLPTYFGEREQTHMVAENLTIHVLGRQAIISLKLLAASPSERKHSSDLKALSPTATELRVALDFVLETDASQPRVDDLELILRQIKGAV